MRFDRIILCAALALGAAGLASATPQLRLQSAALGPYTIAAGANLNSGQPIVVEAGNIGSGAMSLSVTSSVKWLTATVGAASSCSAYPTCYAISITGATTTLTAGTYTGVLTVTSPGTIDAPQTITVTVQVGTAVPSKLSFYVAPGGSATTQFSTVSPVTATSSAGWLSVGVEGSGTFKFNVPYQLKVTAASNMSANAYTGTATLSGSSFAPDNTTVNVTMNVTTSPIAAPSPAVLNFEVPANTIKQTIPVVVSNSGQGTLTVSGATATAADSGTWLTATQNGNTVSVTVDSTNLTAGTYTGTVDIASNAANTVTIPVNFNVIAQGTAWANVGGAVNNATFIPGETVAAGDIMAVFGSQFLYSQDPVFAANVPLPTTLGTTSTTQVLVNGVAAPLYFASYGQIDFQMPENVPAGMATVQIVRDSKPGNLISVQVAANRPRILPFSYGNYGIIENATEKGFAVSQAAGKALGLPVVNPAKAGVDFLTIYAIGLGPTSPIVASGTAAPSTPLANVVLPTVVTFTTTNPFNSPVNATPSFVGLAPGFVGLYQVNVQVPVNSPKGDSVGIFLVNGGQISNTVNIAVN